MLFNEGVRPGVEAISPTGVWAYNCSPPEPVVISEGTMPTNIDGFTVYGDIEARWLALGGVNSGLGLPVSNEDWTYDHIGRTQNFHGGIMSWHPQNPTPKAFFIWGLIGERWLTISREQFGYPITDELVTGSDPRGRYNHLRAYRSDGSLIGESSIFFLPGIGAHEVYGAIRDFWAAQGWDGGPLGFPVTPEHASLDGQFREQQFQHGTVAWSGATGAFLKKPSIHLQDEVDHILVSGESFTPNEQVQVSYNYRDSFGLTTNGDSPILTQTDDNGSFGGVSFDLNGSGTIAYINVKGFDPATHLEDTKSLRGDA